MDENNNINEQVNPSVEPQVPVEPQSPVETPVEPVQAEPVAPVTPVTPAPEAQVVQPAPPVQPQGVVEQPPKKKMGGIIFAIIVVILILIIGILAIGLIAVVLIRQGGNTTTTTATTQTQTITQGTQPITVTTQPNTTTEARTTRPVDTPTPTRTDGQTVKVGSYEVTIPSGYIKYGDSAGYPIIVNQTKKIQIVLNYNAYYTYDEIVQNPNLAIKELQKSGFTVSTGNQVVKDGHDWLMFDLKSNTIPTGFKYVYAVSSFQTGILEVAILLPETTSVETVVTDLNTIVDSSKAGSSSFAPSTSTDKDINTSSFDKLDDRLFE